MQPQYVIINLNKFFVKKHHKIANHKERHINHTNNESHLYMQTQNKNVFLIY